MLCDVTNRPLKRCGSRILDDADSISRITVEFLEMWTPISRSISLPELRTCLEISLWTETKESGVEMIVSFLKGRRDPNISPRMCEAQTSSNNPIHSISDIKHDARAHICHYLII